jgi:hypothetical protein
MRTTTLAIFLATFVVLGGCSNSTAPELKGEAQKVSGNFPVLSWNALDICRTAAHFFHGKEDKPHTFQSGGISCPPI